MDQNDMATMTTEAIESGRVTGRLDELNAVAGWLQDWLRDHQNAEGVREFASGLTDFLIERMREARRGS